MSEKKRPGRPPYPAELRERAMVFDHQDGYPSQWQAIQSMAEKLSVHRETLRLWVRRAETDAGHRPGLTTDERARMKQLEKETPSCAGPTQSWLIGRALGSEHDVLPGRTEAPRRR